MNPLQKEVRNEMKIFTAPKAIVGIMVIGVILFTLFVQIPTNGLNGANGMNGTNGVNGTNGTNGQDGATGPAGVSISNIQEILFNDTSTLVVFYSNGTIQVLPTITTVQNIVNNITSISVYPTTY